MSASDRGRRDASRPPREAWRRGAGGGGRIGRWVMGSSLVWSLAGCPDPGSAADPRVQAEAHAIWNERCTNCHGPAGDGDGPQARHLLVPPRRLSDRAWQSTVTDEHLRKVIVEGGAAVGLDPAMAANPDLAAKPAVVEALVRRVRRL